MKILSLGEFFYVKILKDAPICIGELQLLWQDKNHEDLLLSSVRLYYLPENTPEGRLAKHGKVIPALFLFISFSGCHTV